MYLCPAPAPLVSPATRSPHAQHKPIDISCKTRKKRTILTAFLGGRHRCFFGALQTFWPVGPLVVISDGQSGHAPSGSWQSSRGLGQLCSEMWPQCVIPRSVTGQNSLSRSRKHTPRNRMYLFMKDFQQSNWKESSRSRKGRATLWSLPCQDPIRAPLSMKPETEVAETARSQDGTLELLFIFPIVFHI